MYFPQLRLVLLLAALTAPCISTASGTVQIVAHPNAPVSELSAATLRGIFSMRVRNWPADGPVRVFVLPDRDDHHVAFAKQVLRVYPYVLRDTWDRMVFTGTGTAPTEVKDQNELLRVVGSTPGAIGYVQNGPLDNNKLKILEIR